MTSPSLGNRRLKKYPASTAKKTLLLLGDLPSGSIIIFHRSARIKWLIGMKYQVFYLLDFFFTERPNSQPQKKNSQPKEE
ncbi:MAG: hypothetical protein EBU80_12585 [Chitinophagia bacterium]|nr:hypothetical protein [Chitinophagia bacterium]